MTGRSFSASNGSSTHSCRDLWLLTGAKAANGSAASPSSRPMARSASSRTFSMPAALRPTATEASAEAEAWQSRQPRT